MKNERKAHEARANTLMAGLDFTHPSVAYAVYVLAKDGENVHVPAPARADVIEAYQEVRRQLVESQRHSRGGGRIAADTVDAIAQLDRTIASIEAQPIPAGESLVTEPDAVVADANGADVSGLGESLRTRDVEYPGII